MMAAETDNNDAGAKDHNDGDGTDANDAGEKGRTIIMPKVDKVHNFESAESLSQRRT